MSPYRSRDVHHRAREDVCLLFDIDWRSQMNDFGSDGLKCRLQGMVIRDEFLCPIMYQLFRDPVIAQDGHTYERTAIEKWLEKNSTSPRTGHVLVK
jgi:hypothetical protein